jgi:putative chitinase
MATFRQNLVSESRDSLRDYFEQNTGIIGQTIRRRREKVEKNKKVQAQVERISSSTNKLRMTNAALSSIEASFIQISKNMQLIADAMGAEVTLQKDLDGYEKRLDEISEKKLKIEREASEKKQKDLNNTDKKVNDVVKQQAKDKSLFEKIIDALDDLPGGKRGGKGGGRTGPSRAPPKTPPTPSRAPPKIPPKTSTPRGFKIPGGLKAAGSVVGKIAGGASLAYGAYKSAKFARQSELGRRLREGQGSAAQAVLRGRDQMIEGPGGEQRLVKGRNTSYGTSITPEEAIAILNQPESPGKKRDIAAFGGIERLQEIAETAAKPAAAVKVAPVAGTSTAGAGRGSVYPEFVKPVPIQTDTPEAVLVDSSGQAVLTGAGAPVTLGSIQVKPPVRAAEPAAAVVTPPPAAPVTKPPVATVSPAPVSKPVGLVGSIVASLKETGITSAKAISNILATIKAETNFKVRSENLNYRSAEAIQKTFGVKRIPTLEFAQQFVGNGEALANEVYKKTDGNSAPGDGFKYRGRGWIQHTGKNQYAAIAKYTGVDVLNNPDLLNDPTVATKALAWFFLQYKRKKPEQLENMSEVNRAVGFADTTGEKAALRTKSAELITASISSGQDLEGLSSQPASSKKLNPNQNITVVQNNNTTTVKKPGTAVAQQRMPVVGA